MANVQVQNNIAKALDMGMIINPDTVRTVLDTKMVANPHEIPFVDNPDLPDMSDIDSKLVTGEKQLEEVIMYGIAKMYEVYNDAKAAEPSKQARLYEVANQLMTNTLTAITHKTKLQLDKKKMRMSENDYNKPGREGGSGVTNNNVYIGTREDLMKMLSDKK